MVFAGESLAPGGKARTQDASDNEAGRKATAIKQLKTLRTQSIERPYNMIKIIGNAVMFVPDDIYTLALK